MTPRTLDLPAELMLDKSIVPVGALPEGDPINVLFTGATGYLGTFFLHELLTTTAADVYCLVRADDERHAYGRIRAAMLHHDLWDDGFSARVVPVLGNAGRPNLGLTPRVFDELSECCDTVVHGAANVNFLFPYRALKAANVTATIDALRLACRRRQKHFHFVSTIGIFLSPEFAGGAISERDELSHIPLRANGYSQTKWVAERALHLARDRGIPATIHRPGFIGWYGKTGTFNDKDFVSGLLRASLVLGHAPDVDFVVDVAPVDFVVAAMRWIVARGNLAGKTYHLNNPHPRRWREIVDLCASAGTKLSLVPYEEFRSELATLRDPMLHRFATMLPDTPDEAGSIFSALEAPPTFGFDDVSTALEGSGIECEPLGTDYVRAFVRNAGSVATRAVSSTHVRRPDLRTGTG